MATVDFLHPLTGDTVGTTFEVVVSYDFSGHFDANKSVKLDVTLTLTLTSANTGFNASVPKHLTITDANKVDECTHMFSGVTANTIASGDYVLRVASNYPGNDPPEDEESTIFVTETLIVSVETVGPVHPVRGEVLANTKYLIEGSYDTAKGDMVKVRKMKLNRGVGWHEIGPWKEATCDPVAGKWNVEITIANDQANHRYNFTAKLLKNGSDVLNGQASKGRKSIAE